AGRIGLAAWLVAAADSGRLRRVAGVGMICRWTSRRQAAWGGHLTTTGGQAAIARRSTPRVHAADHGPDLSIHAATADVHVDCRHHQAVLPAVAIHAPSDRPAPRRYKRVCLDHNNKENDLRPGLDRHCDMACRYALVPRHLQACNTVPGHAHSLCDKPPGLGSHRLWSRL